MRFVLVTQAAADEPPGLFTRGDTELAVIRAEETVRYLRGEQLQPAHLCYFGVHRVLSLSKAADEGTGGAVAKLDAGTAVRSGSRTTVGDVTGADDVAAVAGAGTGKAGALHEEVAPVIARLLQRGGDACIFALGDTIDEPVFGPHGLLMSAVQQLLAGKLHGTQLLASVVAVDETARVASEQVSDLLRPVAGRNRGTTEVLLNSAPTALALLRSAGMRWAKPASPAHPPSHPPDRNLPVQCVPPTYSFPPHRVPDPSHPSTGSTPTLPTRPLFF